MFLCNHAVLFVMVALFWTANCGMRIANAVEIRIDAIDFDKSFGAIKGMADDGFSAGGPSFIMNGGAEYIIQIPVAANYKLSALIAGSDKRPVDVFIDDRLVITGFDNKTGDWMTISAQWFDQGEIPFTAGSHRIAFKPKGPMPHFCSFKLTTAEPFPRAPFPATTIEPGAVEPAWITLTKLLKRRGGWRPHRTAQAYAEAERILVGPGTVDEQRALITLLAIGQSPFAIGAKLSASDILSHPAVQELHQRGIPGRKLPLSSAALQAGVSAWAASVDRPKENRDPLDLRRDCYVAMFGTGAGSVSAEIALADLGLVGPCAVHDCWAETDLPVAKGVVILSAKAKSVRLYRISATDPAKNHLNPRGDLLAASEKILYKKTPQEDLYGYLLRPAGSSQKALPAILYFSGGGWNANNVTWVIQECAWFRDHGIIAIACDYRVAGRHGTDIPAAVADSKSAVRYVRAHAKELGVDPERIIVAGGSAGGHIAACTAMPGHDEPGEDPSFSSRANALVLGNPVVGKGFNEGFFDQNPTMSPLELAKQKGWPPTILINGTADTITPQAGAELFVQRMKEAGNICELISIVGGGHGATWPTSSAHFEPAFTRVVSFLREHGFVSKGP